MTKETLADLLNDREIGDEITEEEELQAKSAGLLVIFGASDDLCELRGAINEEIGAYPGDRPSAVAFIKGGKLLPEIDDDDEDVLEKYGVLGRLREEREAATKVVARWEDDGYSWTYETDASHATFDILDGGEKYCRGIVLDLTRLP